MAKTLSEKTEAREMQKLMAGAKASAAQLSRDEKEEQQFREKAEKYGVALSALSEGNTTAHRNVMNRVRELRYELKRALKGGISEIDLQELLDFNAVELETAWVTDSLKEQVERYKRLAEIKQEFMKEHPEPSLEQMMRIQAEVNSKTDEELSREADRYIGYEGNSPNGYVNPYRLELVASRLRQSKITDADLTYKLLRGAMEDHHYLSQHLNTEEGRAISTEVRQFEKSPGNFQVLMKNQHGGLSAAPFQFKELMSDVLESVKQEVADEPVSQRYKE